MKMTRNFSVHRVALKHSHAHSFSSCPKLLQIVSEQSSWKQNCVVCKAGTISSLALYRSLPTLIYMIS